MEFFTKGKHGKIYREGKYAIKQALPRRVKNETFWIKKLNRYGIGSKLKEVNDDNFKYEFVDGPFILEYLSKNKDWKIIEDVLKQCRIMDKMKMNKLEMHNPYKHIIINKNKKPVMIDFERAYSTENPKNVTQFCQYLMSKNFTEALNLTINKKELIPIVKEYKKNKTDNNFNEIVKFFKKKFI
jgi:putative serine/threonine protein kinase